MRGSFVLNEVAIGFWRNLTMTVAMIITTAISLGLLGASGLVYTQVSEMRDYFYDDIEMSIFLERTVTDEQRDGLKNELESDPQVDSVIYESQEEAYNRFREQFKESPDLVESVRPEALPESFRVKLVDPEELESVAKKYSGQTGVDQVADQEEIVGPLFDILGNIQLAALVIAAVQGVAALLLISNMIQIAAFNRRREVSIMRLVGAPNWYVQLPFVMEAAAAGLIGAIIAGIGLFLMKWLVVDNILDGTLEGVVPTWEWVWILLTMPVLAGLAVIISSVTGWLTLRYYVKV